MFIGARFLIGLGLTIANNGAAMLIPELSYPSYRAPLSSLYNSLWYSGAIIAAWSTFGTFKINSSWSWRIPSALQGVPSVLQLSLLWFGPESPRWLASKGRDADALRLLAYYHADGNEQDPLVQYEYEEIRAAIELDRAVVASVGWKSLIKTPGNRKRLTIVVAIAWFSQWSGNGLVSFYLKEVFETIGITDATIQLLINGILQIWNLAWAVTAASLVERIGRRILFISSCVGMLLFFTLQTVCSARYAITRSDSAAHAVIAFIFLFYASYDIAFTPLIISYTLEILPYPLRAKGFAVFGFILYLALIFNQYVNPVALDRIGWRYYVSLPLLTRRRDAFLTFLLQIVYCCWLAFEGAFCYFFIIETKGLSLEETAALFDGEEAVDKIHARGRTTGDERDAKLEEFTSDHQEFSLDSLARLN
jgi:sugar porter (SP) family MFS transporter